LNNTRPSSLCTYSCKLPQRRRHTEFTVMC